MRWFNRDSPNKTYRISSLETAIAKLASEVVALRTIAEKTQAGVEHVQASLDANHVAHAECSTLQDGRWQLSEQRWQAHSQSHDRLERDLQELTALVKRNAEDIRILSGNLSRMAERQRKDE